MGEDMEQRIEQYTGCPAMTKIGRADSVKEVGVKDLKYK